MQWLHRLADDESLQSLYIHLHVLADIILSVLQPDRKAMRKLYT